MRLFTPRDKDLCLARQPYGGSQRVWIREGLILLLFMSWP